MIAVARKSAELTAVARVRIFLHVVSRHRLKLAAP